MPLLIPSILTDSEDDYQGKLRKSEHVCDLIQIDIVDGKFAPNTTIGIETVKKFPSSKLLEIQLMTSEVESYIEELAPLEYVSRIIVPFEIKGDMLEYFYHIRSHEKQVGLSINPDTPLESVKHLLDDIDMILFLAVNPGFSGQAFNDVVFGKIEEVKSLSDGPPIEVDGGVNFETAGKLAAAGVDFLAVNSVIFKAPDFFVAFEKLEKLVSNSH